MKKSIIILIALVCFANSSFSQIKEVDNTVGKTIILKSEVLNEEREVQIYLPDSYTSSEQNYPVLYVLDGQEYFLHGVAYQDMLRFRDKTPEFIIVGINTDRQKRRTLFFKESDQFIEFLDKELIPFIDINYRTAKEKERLFFGWEMAAGLGLQIVAEQENIFSGFILASPTHATNKRVDALVEFKKNKVHSNKFLLLSAAPEEGWITKDTVFLTAIKKQNWRYTVLDREDHYTTPFKTIHEGLSDYFSDYKPIRLRSLKAYDEYGGLKALRAYYKKRGERYNLSTGIHKETKHFLIYNALQEDNYKRFEEYVNEFRGYIEENSRDFWLNRYAKFYLKHKNLEKALHLYNFGIDKYPESDVLYAGLGDLYTAQGDIKKADEAYKNATDLKKEN